ncbi:cupin-like domain-containing protein [Paraburkholderia sp. B3]|uniref:cupin-like domain-containing protein n=1 Tax=Paraburkholderia sp. B3 TaxID=3134791 RepID=UPI003981D6B2
MRHALAPSRGARFPTVAPLSGASPEGLVALLAEHYVPVARPVCVDLCIADRPAARWRFTLSDTIGCTHPDASGDAPAARITMTSAALDSMLANPTRFDPRSAEIAALGGVRMGGSPRLAAYWLQLLKRPTSEGVAALERARARTLPSLHGVSSVNARETREWPQRIVASILAGLPLRVRAALDWPEVNWTLAQWRERDGAVVLRDDPRTGRAQTLRDFMTALGETGAATSVEATYTGGSPTPRAWDARFRVPRLPATLFGPAQLWFGQHGEDTLVTHLHCDLENSFLAQVHGGKRVRLFAPHEEHNVYALDAFNTYRPCRVDAGAPDLSRFPRFAKARFVEVVIEPGDLLVIPTGWFHCVWAKGATLSISRFAGDAAIESHAHTVGLPHPSAVAVTA